MMTNQRISWPLHGMTNRRISRSLRKTVDRCVSRFQWGMAERCVCVEGGSSGYVGYVADLRRSLHDWSAGCRCLPAAQQCIDSQRGTIQRRRHISSMLVFVCSNRRWRYRCLHVGKPGRVAARRGIIAVRRPGCHYCAVCWCPRLPLRPIASGSGRVCGDSILYVSTLPTEAGVFWEFGSARATFLHDL